MNETRLPVVFSQLRQEGEEWQANILFCGFNLSEDFLDLVRDDPRRITAERVKGSSAATLTAVFTHVKDAYDFFDVYCEFMHFHRNSEKWGVTYWGAAYGEEPRGPEQLRALYPEVAALVWDEPAPPEPRVLKPGLHILPPSLWWPWIWRHCCRAMVYLGLRKQDG